MIIPGIVLLIAGFLLKISILWPIGIVTTFNRHPQFLM